MKRVNKTISSALIGLFLVGCSLLSVQRSPAEQAWSGHGEVHQAAKTLRPGLTPVSVERVSASTATVAWRSSWQGRSHIVYGHSPKLLPETADKTRSTANRELQLTRLKPGTRYYFQVETETPLGIARSAVLSFRTR